jgi:hypothetical protein
MGPVVGQDITLTSLTGLTDRSIIAQRIEQASLLAIEQVVNQRDFEYKTPLAQTLLAFKAPEFRVTFQDGALTMSDKELWEVCKDKVAAYPDYRVDVVECFTDVDVAEGTALVYLRSQVAEGAGIVVEGCSLLEWKLIGSGRRARWVHSKHTIMRGFTGAPDITIWQV